MKGYYAIIQWCPDAHRGELINIGIILACEARAYIGARFLQTHDRLLRAFGDSLDTALLYGAIQNMQSYIDRNSEQLCEHAEFADLGKVHRNNIVLSPPRPFLVEDPETVLEQLYDRLVATELVGVEQI